MDTDCIKFGAEAIDIAERQLDASFECDYDSRGIDRLYERFLNSGEKRHRSWLRKHLPAFFPTIDARPRWVERSKPWPFHNGNPMIFVGQIFQEKVAFDAPDGHKEMQDVTFYVFGYRELGQIGLMSYEVVEQFAELASL